MEQVTCNPFAGFIQTEQQLRTELKNIPFVATLINVIAEANALNQEEFELEITKFKKGENDNRISTCFGRIYGVLNTIAQDLKDPEPIDILKSETMQNALSKFVEVPRIKQIINLGRTPEISNKFTEIVNRIENTVGKDVAFDTFKKIGVIYKPESKSAQTFKAKLAKAWAAVVAFFKSLCCSLCCCKKKEKNEGNANLNQNPEKIVTNDGEPQAVLL